MIDSHVDDVMKSDNKIIGLENVSVRYRTTSEQISGLKEYFVRLLKRQVKTKEFLALRDVSFSVNRGEVFGLIGHNGAGKSTLMKLVARVLRPSSGRIWLHGKVAPLLELGAGFHPELTGRENIYLNGSILGYNRIEMEQKLPGIVDFAELWDFIDAPIRTYSSGMWARLGFSVATATKPDILIVDEILSVGDDIFQRKSYERILQFREQGTTILLVSHNRRTIEAMCHRVAWLDHGNIKAIGPAPDVLGKYQEYNAQQVIDEFINEPKIGIQPSDQHHSKIIQITKIYLEDASGNVQPVFQTNQSVDVVIEYEANQPVLSPVFGFAIYRQDGIHITGPNTAFSNYQIKKVEGEGIVRYHIPKLPLLDGLYYLSVAVVSPEDFIYDSKERAYPFRVVNFQNMKEQFGFITLGGDWEH